MASPVNDNLTFATGRRRVVAGRKALPSWRTAMPNRTWRVLDMPGTNTLDDVSSTKNPAVNPNYPSAPPWYGTTGTLAIFVAWNGMGWRADVNEAFTFLAGGHADYGGNEGYAIRFDQDVPTWSMTGYPSGAIGHAAYGYDPVNAWLFSDGRPMAMHLNDYLVYCPFDGSYLAIAGSSPFTLGGAGTVVSRRVWQHDPATGLYTLRATHSDQVNFAHCSACYDPVDQVVWSINDNGGAGLCRFDPADNTYVTVGFAIGGHAIESVLRFDPVRNVALVFGRGLPTGFRVYSKSAPKNMSSLFTPSNVVGTPPTDADLFGPGVVYVPEADKWILWPATSTTYPTTDFFVLTPPSVGSDLRTAQWTWSRLQPAPENAAAPTAATPQGVFGRFIWSSRLECLLLCNAVTEKWRAFAINKGLF